MVLGRLEVGLDVHAKFVFYVFCVSPCALFVFCVCPGGVDSLFVCSGLLPSKQGAQCNAGNKQLVTMCCVWLCACVSMCLFLSMCVRVCPCLCVYAPGVMYSKQGELLASYNDEVRVRVEKSESERGSETARLCVTVPS